MAVNADPSNAALRLHWCQLLAQAGQAERVLQECGKILAEVPDNVQALRLAAPAADALGKRPLAEGYRRLLQALEGAQPADIPHQAPPPPPSQAQADPSGLALAEQPPKEDEEEDWQARLLVESVFSDTEEDADLELPGVTLADVAGLEQVKRRLNVAFLAPLKDKAMQRFYGKSLRGGLLLYGPPGCGKTFLARATAGELGAHFLSVSLADVLDMWIGGSEKNLQDLFNTARRKTPCVLFFDEVDALGRKRSLVRTSGISTVVNQFLQEMDSVNNNNEGVFVLAATNQPWDVDAALRRPGRLDRTLLVLPPDAPARAFIFNASMDKRPTQGIDPNWVAQQTEGFSGADMAHLAEAAAEYAMEAAIKSGNPGPINMTHVKSALRDVRPSTGPWLQSASNYATFNNDGGEYDDLVAYLKQRKFL